MGKLAKCVGFDFKIHNFTPYDAPKSLKIAYLQRTLMSYIRKMYEL